MQYEVWARSRESKVYEFIEAFQNEQQKYYLLDQLDPEVYYEAMILKTEWNQIPVCILFKEITQGKVLRRRH